MEKYSDYFKDKKITVMGLGLLGRGVGDAEYIARAGAAEVIVTDLKNKEALEEPFDRLKGFENVRFVFGEHRMEDFEGRDLVLVAAGVPLDSPYVARAVEDGARKVQSAALFAELSKIPIIGITGTRGKSTVTHMIHHVLEHVTGEEVLLGGNIRGVSNLQLLKDVKDDSLAVMELDSWQLQGFGWAEISPQIAVFTSFMEDHMNYYAGSMDAYFADKANIFLNQDEGDVFVTTPEVFARAQEFAKGKSITLGQEIVLTDASAVPEDAKLSMPGEHNRQNAALAVKALEATGLSEAEILEGFTTFRGVPGRLELLKEIGLPATPAHAGQAGGVKIFNDNNATTPQATAAGIEAVAGDQNVVLIAGGSDKNLDLAPLVMAIRKHCRTLVLIPGTGTERFKKELNSNVNITIHETENLKDAVAAALRAAAEGDVILFSPAFASFGMFVNEYERNDQFVSLISEYE